MAEATVQYDAVKYREKDPRRAPRLSGRQLVTVDET